MTAPENMKRHAGSVSLHPQLVAYLFAAQPQLFPRAHVSLQPQGASQMHRPASPPQPQSVV